MKRSIPIPMALGITLLLTGIAGGFTRCASSTKITGTWKNPETAQANTAYRNVFIAAITDNLSAKQTVENDLEGQLRKQGIGTTKSGNMFSPNFTKVQLNDKEAIVQKVRDNGNDAILTVTLIAEKNQLRYVPGDMAYAPYPRHGWYGNFSGYYNYWAPQTYTPGYYTDDDVYFIETNLYDVQSEKLVWSAQSQTYNPSTLEKFSRTFAKVTADKMRSEGIIR
jgi:hypothetical protein